MTDKPELGSREWYQQALADVRGVWEGAPARVDKSRPVIDPKSTAGHGVQQQRRGRMGSVQMEPTLSLRAKGVV